MQLRNWSEIYKHYSTWVSIIIIVLNVLLTIFSVIPLSWVAPINTVLGTLVLVAKSIKQGLDDINTIKEKD